MGKPRLRDLGIAIGRYPVGPHNAITDVPGVLVGHRTLIRDGTSVARTGVTIVVPRDGKVHEDFVFAGYHSFNGCGEMTGLLWIEESGLLMSPVALTNTSQVGLVRDCVTRYAVEKFDGAGYWLPVVAETWDGWLNDARTPHLTEEDVFTAIDSAASGPVSEGNVGGGTGMICHDFKGGIGTASRLVETGSGPYFLGALVQTNYGERHTLRVDGVPAGREIGPERTPLPWPAAPLSSSIIVVIATDAPLLPGQCRSLAKRATVGLARAGGVGLPFSGDLFLAFATGNHIPRSGRPEGGAAGLLALQMLAPDQMSALYEATADLVEESILNALLAAETMTGREGHVAHALPIDALEEVMARHRPR